MHYEQAAITRTLVKFLIEHRHIHNRGIGILKECLSLLESGEAKAAFEKYEHFISSCGLGRMGCFDDTGVSVIYEHETPEYVDVIFRALLTKWSITMRHLGSRTS